MNSRESKHSPQNCHFIRTVAILFCVIFLGLFGIKSVHAAYITNPPGENDLEWQLNDNAASTTVAGGSTLNGWNLKGALVGGSTTAQVASTLNGYPAFHLNSTASSSGQYVNINLGTIQPYEITNLWNKYSGNPVNTAEDDDGAIVRNPNGPNGGDWYSFGSIGATGVYRLESTDLIHWTGQTQVLAAGSSTAWDAVMQNGYAFQDPLNGGEWVLFYRGKSQGGSTYQTGMAILALDVRHSRIGYALFSGPKRLLDWGVNTVPSQCSNRAQWIRGKMASLLRHGSPVCIVMKQHRLAKLPRNTNGTSILKAVQSVAEEHGIPMYVVGRDEIQSAFRIFKARTKEEMACAIVGIFPELLVRLPPKRKTWQPEAHGMIIFDAIATGIAYWQRSLPRK